MSIRCSLGHENPDGSVFCDECGERLTPETGEINLPAGDVQTAPTMPATSPADSSPSIASAPTMTAVAPRLIVQADNASFDLAGKSEVLIGREDPVSNIYPDIDLTPHGGEEGGVSRMHAKVMSQGAQYMLEDQNSTNFTFLNRQKLAPKTPTPLNDGDEIRLGRIVMTFHTA